MQVQAEDSVEPTLGKFYYEGNAKLHEGYALCRNSDKGVAADGDDAAERASHVEQPATGNLDDFVGVVHEMSDGAQGPCWVTVIMDGFANVHMDVNPSLGDILYPQNASFALGSSDAKSSVGATTDITVTRGFAKTLQAADRSGVAGLNLCRIAADQFIETSTA